MENKKRGQVKIISALLTILGFIILVSAAVTNSNSFIISFNESLNITLVAVITNGTINDTPITDETLPEKPTKNLTKIIENTKNKLNKETEDYLKNIKNKKEVNEYIIKFRDFIDESKLVNITLEKKIDKFKVAKVRGEIENIEDLIEDNEIEFLELEQNVELLEENIPFNIKKVKADSVWNLSNGTGVKVAVLDTGIGLHDDLSILGGVSFVDNNYHDSYGHGTKIAGVIAALLNNEGLVGVAPNVNLYSVKIMQGPTGDLSNAIAGIEWIIDNNMDIVSMSFGFESYSQIFKEVLEEAYDNGILLVAASGNEGTDNILYPAKYSSVIAVGASTQDDNIASFSSYGFEQELVAPGVDINSTSLSNTHSVSSGTSMSAPHVSGVAALIKSYNNSLTNIEIRNKLRNDALDLGEDGKDDLFGYGLVQVDLEGFNLIEINESYFYEVFNITNFKTPEEEYLFWLNGTGTIDDVNFEEGYYLINLIFSDGREKSNIYQVNENGTIKILIGLNIVYYDDYTAHGTTTSDAKTWKGEMLKVVNEDEDPNNLDAECFDYDDDGPLGWECFYKSGTKSDCETYSFGLPPARQVFYNNCALGEGTCQEGITQNHTISTDPLSSSHWYNAVDVIAYYDCDNSAGNQDYDDNYEDYFVFDRKRAVCTSTTGYKIEGLTSTDDGWDILTIVSCPSGSVCSSDLDEQLIFSKNAAIPDPCVSLCSGIIEVNVVDSLGEPMSGSYVYVNSVSNGTTNSDGKLDIKFGSVGCGINQNISVFCYNNQSKFCTEDIAKMDFADDTDSLMFDCNLCKNEKDLSIGLGNTKVNSASGNYYDVIINVQTENVYTNNLNVTIKGQSETTGLIERENSALISVSKSDKNVTASINLNMADINYLHIYVDPNNEVNEPKTNNYVLRPFIQKPVKAYLLVETGLDKADEAIEDYLGLFIDRQSSSSSEYLNIIVGTKSSTFKTKVNPYTKSNLNKKYYYDSKARAIKYNNEYVGTTPYNGIVGGFWRSYDGSRYITAYGNDVDGTVAAVKKLISAKDLFLTTGPSSWDERTVVIDDYDITGLSVMDLFHNQENKDFYNYRDSDNFKAVVERILTDNNYEISIKTVKTRNDNTTLRLKNANTDYSQNYKDAIVENPQPVVLAHGIHSDLNTWNDFAQDLAKSGRDSWIIEMYGGPTTECDTCSVYGFDDLRYYYWPASIAGVQQYSGENSLSYVGYDLGCTVALESLENYSNGLNNAGYYFDTDTGTYKYTDLSSNPIETFVGVGCIGNFTRASYYAPNQKLPFISEKIRVNSGDYQNGSIVYNFYDGHLPGGYYKTIFFLKSILTGKYPGTTWLVTIPINILVNSLTVFPALNSPPVSMGVYQDLIEWMNNPGQIKIGEDVNIHNVAIIQNVYREDTGAGMNQVHYNKDTDSFISRDDQEGICKNINSENKYYISFYDLEHFRPLFAFDKNKKTQSAIKEFLNDQKISESKNYDIISTNDNCQSSG